MDELQEIKRRMTAKIDAYDVSENVNQFFIGDQPLWLDKATRTGLSFSLEMEAKAGRKESKLWYGKICFTLPIETLRQMLEAVEIYAKDCYNVTARHRAEVDAMTKVGEVSSFDYKAGYPEKPRF